VRANTLKITRAALLAALASAGCEAEPTRFVPEGLRVLAGSPRHLPGQREGLFQLQDEASMLIAHLLAPRAGQRILDACAAPGGKTTHIAALSSNSADILALDLHPRRVKLVTAGATRLGCRGIAAQAWDLTEPPAFLEQGSFDRVLVDAPCSGLGVLRRNPEIRWRRQPEDLTNLAARQKLILGNVAALVRPGGRLLYSVCTMASEETDEVVTAFLEKHPEFAREDLRPAVPASCQALFDADGVLRSVPHRHDGMDAFFAVAFRRRD